MCSTSLPVETRLMVRRRYQLTRIAEVGVYAPARRLITRRAEVCIYAPAKRVYGRRGHEV
jgi:hypothetical protein